MVEFAVAIKTIAAEIGGLREFRKTGGSLSDFLENRFDREDSPEELAAKIFRYFCADNDGSFNDFMPGVMLAVKFLDQNLPPAPEGQQRQQSLKDLQILLNTRVDEAQLIQWARAWYC